MLSIPPSEPIILRPIQEEIIAACRDTMRNHKRFILQAATGLGKTILATWMIKKAFQKGKKCLFVCDRITLVEQTSKVFEKYGVGHGIIMSNHPGYDPELPVQIASIQTLARRKIQTFDLIFIDEIHSFFKAHQELLQKNKESFVIGLSATPFTAGLGKHFTTHIEPVPMRKLIDDGYLCDFEIYGPDTFDLSKVRTVAGEYKNDDLGDATDTPKLVGDVVDTWFKLARDRKTIVFCTNVAHGRHLAKEFCKRGIKAAEINGYMQKDGEDGREKILESFVTGETQVICSVEILIKGFDVTHVDCVVWATATKSPTKWIQGCGRGLRIHEGKRMCRIIDHGSNAERLGFPDEFEFLELDDGKKGDASKKKKEKKEKLHKKCPSCAYLKPSGVYICPACGFAPVHVEPVETQDGELKKLKRKAKNEYSLLDKKAFLAQLNQYAADKGYKQGGGGCFGWALHAYKDKFGTNPPSAIRWNNRAIPGGDVLGWIKHRNIKNSK